MRSVAADADRSASVVVRLAASLGAAGVRPARSDRAGFHPDRAGTLSRRPVRLRELPYRPRQSRPFAGGRPIETPFGNIVAPNITPDLETGIGGWSDDEFDAAVRKGIRRDGAPLYPAMPYNAYTKMSRDDVLAIRAYLNTVTAGSNPVVANTLPFPFNIRAAMRVWDALYFTEGEYKPDPEKSAEWNRGAFLVDGPATAAPAIRPRRFWAATRPGVISRARTCRAGSRRTSRTMQRPGSVGWSADEMAAYLRPDTTASRRHRPDGGRRFAVELPHDRRRPQAIATYLKIVLRGIEPPRPWLNDPRMGAGEAIYRDQCSACHGLDGRGSRSFSLPLQTLQSPVRVIPPPDSHRVAWRAECRHRSGTHRSRVCPLTAAADGCSGCGGTDLHPQ